MVKLNSQGKQTTAIFIVRFSKDTVEEVVNSADVFRSSPFPFQSFVAKDDINSFREVQGIYSTAALDCDLFQFKNTFMQQADTSRSRIPG